jgi:hypothetical protein
MPLQHNSRRLARVASEPLSSENAYDTVAVNAYKANFSTSTTAANWGPVASHNTVSLKVFEANFSKTTATDWPVSLLIRTWKNS